MLRIVLFMAILSFLANWPSWPGNRGRGGITQRQISHRF